jgi:Zn ribbon nucleic-acid-binding protein
MDTSTGNDLPCPVCNGTDLSVNLWSMDKGEVEALECNTCTAGAPRVAWNARIMTVENIVDKVIYHKDLMVRIIGGKTWGPARIDEVVRLVVKELKK